jgi:hypothetical protein
MCPAILYERKDDHIANESTADLWQIKNVFNYGNCLVHEERRLWLEVYLPSAAIKLFHLGVEMMEQDGCMKLRGTKT